MSARRPPYLGTPQAQARRRLPHRLLWLLALTALWLLTACGGGDPEPKPTDDATRAVIPTPPACQAHPESCL